MFFYDHKFGKQNIGNVKHFVLRIRVTIDKTLKRKYIILLVFFNKCEIYIHNENF